MELKIWIYFSNYFTDDQGIWRESSGNLLAKTQKRRERPCLPQFKCFLAGNTRVDEQVSLTAFHTLFLREHNRMAKNLKKINSHCDGEKVYQETRKIMGAVLQKFLYEDYLPVIIGPKPLPVYDSSIGYDSSINPCSISNAFATAVYRFGHSAVREEFDLLNQKNLNRFLLHRSTFALCSLTAHLSSRKESNPFISGL